MKLIEGLDLALQIKEKETRKSTILRYSSFVNRFTDYLKMREKEQMELEDFRKREAIHYLDYVLCNKGVSPLTRNNYLQAMKTLFYVLTEREYIEENPFAKIKKLKAPKKRRKMFDKTERSIVSNFLKDYDSGLFLAVSLCYYCALRRSELRQLKIGDIDLVKKVITLDGENTKNKDVARITMPKYLVAYLEEIRIKKYPLDYYVFGSDLQPNPIQCGVNSFTRKHRYAMHKLKEYNVLQSIEGKTFYSWKDTAAADMIAAGFNIITIMKHFRHSDVGTTQRYLESFTDYINDVQNFEVNLF
ncbi:site-specific integrase [Aureispira sp. CCB-QB1]|uniref:tyrosine-type recombinase/integrase n=1 Tax=Aureispira sp. CCB-QB1 TaxID=1313421 RepID=UPI000695D17E|nr:site-specific integrase [Aureispira sp. CCB-QB1]